MTRGGSYPAASAAATRWAAMWAWAIICPSRVASSVRATLASEISPISAKLADSSSDVFTAAASASSRRAVAALYRRVAEVATMVTASSRARARKPRTASRNRTCGCDSDWGTESVSSAVRIVATPMAHPQRNAQARLDDIKVLPPPALRGPCPAAMPPGPPPSCARAAAVLHSGVSAPRAGPDRSAVSSGRAGREADGCPGPRPGTRERDPALRRCRPSTGECAGSGRRSRAAGRRSP